MVVQNNLVTRYSGSILLILLLLIVGYAAGAEVNCTLIRLWGHDEEVSGTTPHGIATDAADHVYITDPGNNRVVQYATDRSISTWWDLKDTESGKSGIPYGIAADASYNVYITDRENHTVQKLTMRGREVWGSEGNGDGEFFHPTGIAVDSSGNVYIADTGNNRIQKFHSTGTYLQQWGSQGSTNGVFNGPEDITVDASGQVYVADTGNNRIQKFSPGGTFLQAWEAEGTGDRQFSQPSGIAVDHNGNVFVTDQTTRVRVFNPAGESLFSCDTGESNLDVAVDPSGTMYVLLQSGTRIGIGQYRTQLSAPEETPVQRHTFALVTGNTRAVTIEAIAPEKKAPAAQVTHITMAPTASQVTILSPAPQSAVDQNITEAEPGNQNERQARNTVEEQGILARIAQFFRSLF